MSSGVLDAMEPYQDFLWVLGLCIVLFALTLFFVWFFRMLHGKAVRHRAIRKASKVAEGLGGNDSSCLHGEELAPALRNKQIRYVAFPLSEGSEILYAPPKDSDAPSLFVAGHSLVLTSPLEDFDEEKAAALHHIAESYNSTLKTLYGKSGSYSDTLLVIANNASEAARVKTTSAKVVIGISGLIKELLRLSRNVAPFSGEGTLDTLYASFPDVRLLMKEDREFDPRFEKGKPYIDSKGNTVLFDAAHDGDTIYSFHLYSGRKMQKGKKEE
jgi:hypothetical protein